jgi:hypothetical protein
MIQRIQSVYLLLAAVLLVVCFLFDEGMQPSGLTLCLAVVSLVDIFLFKNRNLQARICLAVMFAGIVYYIFMAVKQPIIGWYSALPMAAVLLHFLARKRILMDEKLVRSLDRIR